MNDTRAMFHPQNVVLCCSVGRWFATPGRWVQFPGLPIREMYVRKTVNALDKWHILFVLQLIQCASGPWLFLQQEKISPINVI